MKIVKDKVQFTCLADLKIKEDEAFLINVECLIDHRRIMLQVKQRPQNPKNDKIADKIEAEYNSEFLTELKKLIKND
jgi:hypothetical protein